MGACRTGIPIQHELAGESIRTAGEASATGASKQEAETAAAKALLEKEPDADEYRIRHWLAGNLCRCTGYDKIIRAVQQAEETLKG